jgi:hypothetical protein
VQWRDVNSTGVALLGGCHRAVWGPEVRPDRDDDSDIVVSCPRAGHPWRTCTLEGEDARLVFGLLHGSRRDATEMALFGGIFLVKFRVSDGRMLEAVLPKSAIAGEPVAIRFGDQSARMPFESWLQVRRIAAGQCKDVTEA